MANHEQQVRIARPANDLEAILRFYRDAAGLEVLDSFEDHAGFDGIMLGNRDQPFHFEFTCERGQSAPRAPTQDHLIVFYVPDTSEWEQRVQRMIAHGFPPVRPYNPYWETAAKTFEDPDGYRLVLANTREKEQR